MALSMYDISVPVYQHRLKALAACLRKGEEHAVALKQNPDYLLDGRLFQDMYPLLKQVQIACDHAKGVSRLAGAEPPTFADNEKTFAELQARIARTQDFIATLNPAKFEGSEDRDINFKIGNHDLSFKGLDYIIGFGMPNFYFHVTTAYAILRHNGVNVGKRDYLDVTMPKLTPTIEEIEALRKTIPPGPVVIVNLLKFKPEGGREAYVRYLQEASRASYPGVEIVYAGNTVRDVGGGEDWDYVIIARYPDFEKFAAAVTAKEYQVDADAHRPAALEKTIMMVTQPNSLQDYFRISGK